ncbi:MAG: TIGR04141 family sporadically distributed protein [Phycisphaerae bacterium]|jgi:uncharacterized protein (TIGR04141 family)
MKFTIYVLSTDVKTFDDAISTNRLQGADSYQYVALSGIDFEAQAYLQRNYETEPGWYDAVRGHCPIDPPPRNVSNSLVVVVKTKSGRHCAVAFGHGHHALNRENIVKEYGREIAERILSPSQIKAVDSKGIGARALQKRNVSPMASDLAEFTLNPNRDRIRRLTGASSDKTLGKRITGATPLAVDGDLLFADLGTVCETILSHHTKTRNQRFAAYDPFVKVEATAVIAALIKKLDKAIQNEPARLGILTGNINDWERIDGVQVRMPGGEWLKCDDFDVASIATALSKDGAKPPIALEAVVRAVDSHGKEVFSDKLIELVTFETEHAKKPYALSDGDWFLLAQDFKERIEYQVRELDVRRDPSFLPPWDLQEHNTELKYNNAAAAAKGSGFVCLDQNEVVTPSSGSIEPCDLLTVDGMFIHVKRWYDSQKLSAHAKQGSNSGQVMRNNQEFRDGLLAKLPPAWLKKKLWKEFSAGFSAKNHKVMIAIADAPHRTIPEDLPIFSKMTLMDECKALRAENYAVEIYHIPLTGASTSATTKMKATAKKRTHRKKSR